MELKPHRIGGEAPARQPGPGDGVLAFFDPLLRRAAMAVERDHSLCRPRHVGHDESDPRIEFAGMPLDLRHHAARLGPGTGLVTEAGVIAAHLVRRTTDRAL